MGSKPARLYGLLTGATVLGAIVWLPVFPRRSTVRAQIIGQAGDEVSFEWSLASVPKHIEGLRYASDSLAPYVVLGVDLLLAVLLCVTVGLFVARKLARRP